MSAASDAADKGFLYHALAPVLRPVARWIAANPSAFLGYGAALMTLALGVLFWGAISLVRQQRDEADDDGSDGADDVQAAATSTAVTDGADLQVGAAAALAR